MKHEGKILGMDIVTTEAVPEDKVCFVGHPGGLEIFRRLEECLKDLRAMIQRGEVVVLPGGDEIH